MDGRPRRSHLYVLLRCMSLLLALFGRNGRSDDVRSLGAGLKQTSRLRASGSENDQLGHSAAVFCRRQSGVVGLTASLLVVLALALQVWLMLRA
jgi:hypothetical protein